QNVAGIDIRGGSTLTQILSGDGLADLLTQELCPEVSINCLITHLSIAAKAAQEFIATGQEITLNFGGTQRRCDLSRDCGHSQFAGGSGLVGGTRFNRCCGFSSSGDLVSRYCVIGGDDCCRVRCRDGGRSRRNQRSRADRG